jgi:hypothetical protein
MMMMMMMMMMVSICDTCEYDIWCSKSVIFRQLAFGVCKAVWFGKWLLHFLEVFRLLLLAAEMLHFLKLQI